ncbi:MAG: hypothetical protein BGO70_16480 [Bacteroidetes bacterium 43-93]|nr:hypothetical protein [Bacteroidota bacterium]OJX01359.1 MAG: hypothetical protein BGO70_16480 [Bacteroidetes bacterium 43-93]
MKGIQITAIAAIVLLLSACTRKQRDTDYTGFITKDSANVMIESYLKSLDTNNEAKPNPELYSLIMDAEELRIYLNQNPEIENIKFMFAHTRQYIDAGNMGKPAAMSSKALTLVVAGYDKRGNYIFAPGNRVPNHCTPCPEFCPKFGTASSNLLQ